MAASLLPNRTFGSRISHNSIISKVARFIERPHCCNYLSGGGYLYCEGNQSHLSDNKRDRIINREVGIKDDLKNIIQKHIGKAVSSLFLEKSIAIINESAENKESFIAAADRISKRIGLFIDKDLAQTVFESLKVEIEKKILSHGTKRRYTRVAFCEKVLVRYAGAHYELDSENLSEGGMYIRTKEPFPAGSELEITFSLGFSKIYLTGVVVYETSPLSDSYKLPPGMAIEFKEIRDKEIEVLRRYVKRALN